jgi:peptide/nickel transport system permease protein
MSTYLLRKALMVVPTLLGASLVVFVGLRVVPGDPARMMIGESGTQQDYERLRAELGLNDRLYVQYARFVVQSLQGDFGRSLRAQEKAITLIGQALPATIELAVASLIIASLAGVSTGIVSAIRQYSLFDNVLMVLVLLGVSMPTFWTGLLAILIFGLYLGLFPVGGALSEGIILPRITGMYTVDSLLQGNLAALQDSLRHLILPAITLGAVPMAVITRMTRSAMLEVLRQEYVVTARSKGLGERAVILRHALCNSLIPVLTVVGLQLGYLLSGAVVTETIFARPGLGRLAITSISYRDYPVVQGIVLLTVLIFVAVNLFVDILYAYLDPQIRYG